MTFKEKMDVVKAKFHRLFFAQEYKMPDGQVLTLDPGPELGAMATINGAPAPDAEYILPDGNVCKVTAGVVAEVAPKPADPAAEPAKPAATMADDVKEAISQIIVKFQEEFEAKLKAQSQDYETQLAAIKAKVEQYSDPITETLKLVEEIANSGADKPAEPKPNQFKINKTENLSDTERRIRETLGTTTN